jgi:hypothetical protein
MWDEKTVGGDLLSLLFILDGSIYRLGVESLIACWLDVIQHFVS